MAEANATKLGGSPSERSFIAKWVLGVSGGILVVLSVTTIFVGGPENTRDVFNMVVPLIGTWIGTVIAYYFSGENFERASQSVQRMVDQVVVERLRGIAARDAMIARGSMKVIHLAAGDDGSGVPLKAGMLDLLKPPVTRLPVLDDKGLIKYIIHQSLVFRFVTEKTIEAAGAAKPFDVTTQTLKHFLDHPGVLDVVAKTMGFLRPDATLADAKARMEAVPGCQDVFITEDGTQATPVQGWLTNVEIAKRARA